MNINFAALALSILSLAFSLLTQIRIARVRRELELQKVELSDPLITVKPARRECIRPAGCDSFQPRDGRGFCRKCGFHEQEHPGRESAPGPALTEEEVNRIVNAAVAPGEATGGDQT